MRIAVTGTPGTGKTTATTHLDTDLEIIHLNALITDAELSTGFDASRQSVIADIESLQAHLAGRDEVIFESHLAHHLSADKIVVLRCHPTVLCERLLDRGMERAKATENAEAEALDVILAEAVDTHRLDHIYEINTTDASPATVAAALDAVIQGDREPSAGTVDFLDYL